MPDLIDAFRRFVELSCTSETTAATAPWKKYGTARVRAGDRTARGVFFDQTTRGL